MEDITSSAETSTGPADIDNSFKMRDRFESPVPVIANLNNNTMTNGMSYSPNSEQLSDISRDVNSPHSLKAMLCPSPTSASVVHGTWHQHIYSKPPSAPTSYFISDILQWSSKQEKRDNENEAVPLDFSNKEVEEDESLPSSPYSSAMSSCLEFDQALDLTTTKRSNSPTFETNNNINTSAKCKSRVTTFKKRPQPLAPKGKRSTPAILPSGNIIIPKIKNLKTKTLLNTKVGPGKTTKSKGKELLNWLTFFTCLKNGN